MGGSAVSALPAAREALRTLLLLPLPLRLLLSMACGCCGVLLLLAASLFTWFACSLASEAPTAEPLSVRRRLESEPPTD